MTDFLVEDLTVTNYTTVYPPNARGNVQHYIESVLGPSRLSLISLIPITVTYTVLWFVGLLGNIATCLVIYKTSYLRTPTNYYLFNLAITDILTFTIGKY